MKDIAHKLPNNFLQKLHKLYPSRYEEIIDTFLQKKITTFRINYLKTDLVTLREKLSRKRIRFKELDYPTGAFLCYSPLRQLQNTDIYQDGLIYVQNVSSMIPVLILSPANNEKILDLCAAPGAKTTQIVSLAPQAQVTAIEKARVRFYKLLTNIKVQGAGNLVKVYLLDGIWVRKKFPEYFDKILVDAPCSTEGRFYINNPRTYKYWKDKKVKEMVHKQKKLLAAAFFALKEGGELIYSTCTFSPEENEGVIDWFLNKFKDKLQILPVEIPLDNISPAFLRWQDKRYSKDLKGVCRVLPNEFMEGFFIARLRKTL
ncbi:MAG: RsmB/NOP family class I SAM-dependent RNA methyltransferase [Candidatus Omnitrophota bacterium]|nr:MAG: RsmB/NOP family class I SAM-dependent RNA methyltransferase [Candidatus Omnitrophota bacterium]